MAFQFVSVRSSECYILKANHQSIMYWISIINNNGRIVAIINLSRRRRVNQKARQTGANVSRPSSGNIPMGNHVQGMGNVVTNMHLNYYGTIYANASSTATQVMDPDKFTKPVVDVLNGPALKSPNVEELGYSDRILQLTMGNSSITTQECANAVVAYSHWPSKAMGMGEAIDKSTEPGPSASRFYTLDSKEWTASGFSGVAYRFPECIENMGMFGQNVHYHYLYRCGYLVHVQVNASKFHAGTLLVVAIPECETAITGAVYDINDQWLLDNPISQLTVYPHQFINVRSNNSATLVLPYVSPNPMENAAAHNPWTVAIIPIVHLNYATGASPAVPITLTVAPMECQFNGLRSAAVFQGIPVMSTIGSGQFITTVRDNGIPIYPEFQADVCHDIPGEYKNFLEVARVGTIMKLSTNLLGVAINPSYTAGQKVFGFPIDFDNDAFRPTYVALLSKFYINWRGSLKLTLTFAGAAMCTAKLVVCYTPPGTQEPSNREEAMLGTSLIWDVGLQSSCTLVIPWISETQYRLTTGQTRAAATGFVTCWMQTRLVNPPSLPAGTSIFATLAAGDDFCFRIPSDSGYYQGPNGDQGRDVTGKVTSNKQPPTVDETTTSAPVAQVGTSPALTAVETGETPQVSAASVMEVRQSAVHFSALATSVENMLSRYALIFESVANTYVSSESNELVGVAFNIPLTFDSIQATAAVKAKFAMSTYLRLDLDVVIMVEVHNFGDTQNLPSGVYAQDNQPLTFQAIYLPPGMPIPPLELKRIDAAAPQWNYPTTPSIYFKNTDPPANFRIPFVGTGSAYVVFYDGYPNLDGQGTYGEYPGNTLGRICVRPCYKVPTVQAGAFRYNIKVFTRPVNVRSFMPRPIKTYKTTGGRVMRAVNVDIAHEAMPKKKRIEEKRVSEIKDWMVWETQKLPVIETEDGPMHVIPISDELVIAPYHWVLADWHNHQRELVWADPDRDVVCFKHKTTHQPKLCTCKKGYWTANMCMFNTTKRARFATWVEGFEVESETRGDHIQLDAIQISKPIPEGWCGSPLFCEHGIVGMATASTDSSSFFTHIASMPHVKFPGMSKWDAEEQGPKEWFSGIISEMGAVFGDGFGDSVKEQVKGFCGKVKEPKDTIVKTCVTWLIKAICACVLISRSWNPGETAACVGVMMGVDLLAGSPFEWVKNQVKQALGFNEVEEQGFVDWVKDFNACASAAKSLEWIGNKIEEFIDWIKKLLQKESPARKRFNQRIEAFPDLMCSIDKIVENRGKYPDDKIQKVIAEMKNLKKAADYYGLKENSFATKQIIHYYKIACDLEKGITKNRVEPVAMCVHGGPGSGKSLATQMLGRVICQHYCGKPYCLPPDPKHFDGYDGQPVVIMDDICQNPDGEDMKLFCQMVSSTEFIPPMAELGDKGKHFTSKFVLCSTNMNQLFPPTIAEPEAIKRRFYLDLDIQIKPEFKNGNRLDASKALEQCSGCNKPNVFQRCCPLICGKAVVFKDRNSNITYTLDQVASLLMRERHKRETVGDKLEALFAKPVDDIDAYCYAWKQGGDEEESHGCELCPKDTFHHKKIHVDEMDWLESDFDKEACILKTYDEMAREGMKNRQPCPKEIQDLLRAVPDPKILSYCEQQGWIFPEDMKRLHVRRECNEWAVWALRGLSALAAISSIVGTIYLIYRLFASQQGPYAGPTQKVLKPPIPRTVVAQGPDYDFATSLHKKSLFPVRCINGPFTALGLKGKWLVLPRHCAVGEEITLCDQEFKVLDNVELECKEGKLEFRCIKIDRPINFPDVTKRIPKKFVETPDCILCINSEKYPTMTCPVGKVKNWGKLVLSGNVTCRTLKYNYPTKSGQCGGVVTKCGQILGIHIGGDGTNGYATAIYQHYFDKLDEAEEQGHIINIQQTKTPVHVSTKTKLQPSVWHDIIPGCKEPAALNQKDKRLEVDLDTAVLSKYDNDDHEISVSKHMKEAVAEYTERLKAIMPENVTEGISLEEAAYGIPDLEGLDLNTSAGYPYTLNGIKKRDILDPETKDTKKLQECLDKYGVDLPFISYLKDELRPLEKIKKGKTRIIECSSMNDTIRMKMMFGKLFQTMHRNPGTITGSAVGCNPDTDWTKFRAEMHDSIIAFDYSNYDASLNKVWFKCLKMVLTNLGFKDLRPIDHIIYSKHIYKNIEYDVEGGMPSGCSGTSIFNSMINNIIIRTLLLDAYKGIDLEQLKMVAYGDDVVATYPFPIDAASLADCGKRYGLKMTPPDKGSEFNNVTWENVTFLKRRFKPAKHYPFLIHPVFEQQELLESLRWTRNPAATQEHVRSLCELAWHSGRKSYEEFCNLIKSTNVGKACILPSYISLKRMWLDQF
ncbi:polyprotein [Rabovirus A]|uniref:Genome polyprotein n=1 Tax=Rabovirus A TaxID=1603962 RepID=A0A2S1YF64_9PICO|nr:polyprotein [Rabovirus A]